MKVEGIEMDENKVQNAQKFEGKQKHMNEYFKL